MDRPEIPSPKQSGRLHWVRVVVIPLAVLSALGVFAWGRLAKERKESIIVAGGPFDAHFAQGLYPDHRQEIKVLLETTISKGTTRADANRILASSFSRETTGGNEVNIASIKSPAGGSHTKVTLIFDAQGRFQDSEVDQHWAYL